MSVEKVSIGRKEGMGEKRERNEKEGKENSMKMKQNGLHVSAYTCLPKNSRFITSMENRHYREDVIQTDPRTNTVADYIDTLLLR